MHSVFLSYAREDHARAKAVAAALEQAGLSVWWDRRLAAGSEYSREIEQALKGAKVVLVLWSRSAVDSSWVRDEAAKGRDSGRLVPATLDGTEAPLGFGQLHTVDLSGRNWKREPLNGLVAAAAEKVGGGAPAEHGRPLPGAPAGALSKPAGARRILAVGAVITAAAAVAALYLAVIPGLRSPETPALEGGKVVIAGFEPLSADPESERLAKLAEGAVERTLSTNFIETVSSRSAPADAARGADFRLTGTVDRAKDGLTVLANVVDPESGRTLWSTEVERAPNESRQLTEELAVVLADVIRCSTYTKRRMPKYNSAEVYSRIFRSCEAERSVGQQYDELAAVSQALVDVAPESAQAWAYLANTTAFLYGEERRQQVKAAARKALQLDPKNGAVRWGLAILPDQSVSLAQRERLLLEGLKLDPDFLWHRNHLGHVMRQVGRTEEALGWYLEFVSNYPLDYAIRPQAAYLLAQTGDMRRARKEFERTAEVRPDTTSAQILAIRAELFYGDLDEARRLLDASTVAPTDRRCAEMTIAALRSSRTPGVEEVKRECAGGMLNPAQVLAKFGHKEAVFQYVAQSGTTRIGTVGPFYLYEPAFAQVRADPRFIPLLVRFGIPQYWLETNKWPDFCRDEKLPYDCRKAAEAAVRESRA